MREWEILKHFYLEFQKGEKRYNGGKPVFAKILADNFPKW